MTLAQAVAAVWLWCSRQYDTADIAEMLGTDEASICALLAVVREQVRAA